MMFLCKWVIFRYQPLIFRGVMMIDGTFSLTFVGVDLKLVGSSVYQDLISLFEADFLKIMNMKGPKKRVDSSIFGGRCGKIPEILKQFPFS